MNIFAPKSPASLYDFYFFYPSMFLFLITSLLIDLGFILLIHFSPLLVWNPLTLLAFRSSPSAVLPHLSTYWGFQLDSFLWRLCFRKFVSIPSIHSLVSSHSTTLLREQKCLQHGIHSGRQNPSWLRTSALEITTRITNTLKSNIKTFILMVNVRTLESWYSESRMDQQPQLPLEAC